MHTYGCLRMDGYLGRCWRGLESLGDGLWTDDARELAWRVHCRWRGGGIDGSLVPRFGDELCWRESSDHGDGTKVKLGWNFFFGMER